MIEVTVKFTMGEIHELKEALEIAQMKLQEYDNLQADELSIKCDGFKDKLYTAAAKAIKEC